MMHGVVFARFSLQTFFITQISLGGYAKTPVTAPLLKIIKCYRARKLRRTYWITGNHYFDLTVWFQCTPFWKRKNCQVVVA